MVEKPEKDRLLSTPMRIARFCRPAACVSSEVHAGRTVPAAMLHKMSRVGDVRLGGVNLLD